MKKILVIALALGAFAVLCKASEIPLVENLVTVNQVYVSSFTATEVPSSATLMKNRTVLFLQNLDASYDVYCGTHAFTITANAAFVAPLTSFKILKSGELTKFDMRGFQLYCLTGGPISKSTMSVVQAW